VTGVTISLPQALAGIRNLMGRLAHAIKPLKSYVISGKVTGMAKRLSQALDGMRILIGRLAHTIKPQESAA
jgi:hypothetical protein